MASTAMTGPCTLLVDNGSLEPAAVLGLRRLAAALEKRTGVSVAPVSMLHSSGIDAGKIEGVPAEILEPALARRIAEVRSDFLIVPLFFGPSGALTDYLPKRVAALREKHPGLASVAVAPALFAKGDDRLAGILADNVRRTRSAPRLVALVDHGSPARAVTEVRNALAAQLAEQFGAGVTVAACSMERRPGDEYAFNEPLLENLLRQPDWNSGEVVVAMQFLLPGKHAGPDGDVSRICATAATENPALRTVMTPLVAEHPLLIDILADRLMFARSGDSVWLNL